MSKSQTVKSHTNHTNHVLFTPKLSLEGRNVLPQLIDYSPYTFQKDQPFLTILKKPLMSMSQKTVQRKERKLVCVVGKAKQFQFRQLHTMGKRRVHGPQSEFWIGNGGEIMSNMISLPKYIALESKKLMVSKKNQDVYYFYMGVGNNSQLVGKVLGRRKNWLPTTKTLFNLRWEQARPKYLVQTAHKQVHNHLPNHQAISDKGSLLRNMKIFCQKINEPIFEILPVCFELNFQNFETCENELKKFLQFYWEDRYKKESLESSNQNQQNKKISLKKNDPLQLPDLDDDEPFENKLQDKRSTPMIKNFRTTKKEVYSPYLQQNLRKKEEIRTLHKNIINKLKPFYSFQDMSAIKKEHNCLNPLLAQVYGDTYLWLLKPTDLNRGRGIKLFRQIEQLSELLFQELSKNEKSSFIIQKYIEKPLLISNRKFDIRVWTLVSQNKQVFMFKEGYMRTSCQQFSLDSNNQFTHLTNNAIQKNSKNYGVFEDGNQISLQYLFNQLVDREDFLNQMKKYIQLSYSSVLNNFFLSQNQNNLSTANHFSPKNPRHSNHSSKKIKYFEIFGYDFMVDVNKHLWLIEVNTNPCLEESSTLLKSLIPRMLDDAFKLTIDKIFPRAQLSQGHKVFSVPGYPDSENMWEKIQLLEVPKANYNI